MQRETEAASPKHGSIEITVDGRPITLDDPETTPNEVLRLAGRHQVSFEGRGDEHIRVHPGGEGRVGLHGAKPGLIRE